MVEELNSENLELKHKLERSSIESKKGGNLQVMNSISQDNLQSIIEIDEVGAEDYC